MRTPLSHLMPDHANRRRFIGIRAVDQIASSSNCTSGRKECASYLVCKAPKFFAASRHAMRNAPQSLEIAEEKILSKVSTSDVLTALCMRALSACRAMDITLLTMCRFASVITVIKMSRGTFGCMVFAQDTSAPLAASNMRHVNGSARCGSGPNRTSKDALQNATNGNRVFPCRLAGRG